MRTDEPNYTQLRELERGGGGELGGERVTFKWGSVGAEIIEQ